MFPRPLQHAGQPAFARQLWDRLFDVLRLPTLPVRWRNQQPGQPIRHVGSMSLTQQVQATVDGCNRTGRGNDVVVGNVEHVRAEVTAGEAPCEQVARHPMRGGFASIQQTGIAQHESAQA